MDAGFTVETANKQGSDVIHSTIVNDLLEADLVIADLTDHNPNVLFELGMRMHADLPVALIKSKDTGKIFDVDNMLRVYEYNPNLWKSTIETDVKELIDHFKAAWDNRASEQTYMKIQRLGDMRAYKQKGVRVSKLTFVLPTNSSPNTRTTPSRKSLGAIKTLKHGVGKHNKSSYSIL